MERMTPDQHLIDDFEALFPSIVGAYKALGVSEPAYYRWRSGKRPVPKYIKKSIRVMTWAINHGYEGESE